MVVHYYRLLPPTPFRASSRTAQKKAGSSLVTFCDIFLRCSIGFVKTKTRYRERNREAVLLFEESARLAVSARNYLVR
jgi:hypothetical protein